MVANVFLIPGIPGTVIRYSQWPPPVPFLGNINQAQSPAVFASIIWPNPVMLALGKLYFLTLNQDGITPENTESGFPLVADFPIPAIYDFLASQLVKVGPVTVFPYDWRLSLEASGARLAAAIQQTLPGLPIYIVAHSLGGLVARTAYRQLAGNPRQADIKRIVTLGTPHWGTFNVWAELLGMGPIAELAKSLSGTGGAQVQSQATVLVRHALQSWPAVYMALPSVTADSPAPHPGDARFALTRAAYGAWVNTMYDAAFDRAHTWQSATPADEPDGLIVPVVGTGFTTVSGTGATDLDSVNRRLWPTTTLGDGIVEEWSARYKASKPYVTVPVEHGMLAQDAGVIARLPTLLINGLAQGARLDLPADPPGRTKALDPTSVPRDMRFDP